MSQLELGSSKDVNMLAEVICFDQYCNTGPTTCTCTVVMFIVTEGVHLHLVDWNYSLIHGNLFPWLNFAQVKNEDPKLWVFGPDVGEIYSMWPLTIKKKETDGLKLVAIMNFYIFWNVVSPFILLVILLIYLILFCTK